MLDGLLYLRSDISGRPFSQSGSSNLNVLLVCGQMNLSGLILMGDSIVPLNGLPLVKVFIY